LSKRFLLICIVAPLSCGGDDASVSPATSIGSALPPGGDGGATPQMPGATPQMPEGTDSTPPPAVGGADASSGEAPDDATDAGTAEDARNAEDAGNAADAGSDAADGELLAACVNDGDCVSGCCLPVDAEGGVCAASSLCEAAPIVGCTEVILRASDGTFLGDATSFLTADSLCNPASAYGSPASPTSIFNPFGTYGNTSGLLSAYSPVTLTPPILVCTTTQAALSPVSKNATLVGVIDPDVLCAALAANGI
jgi:hypothetical protein